MSPGASLEELAAKLAVASDLQEYQLVFVALLGSTAKVPPDDLIVVGGSAIEAYTAGAYASGDIDLVSSEGARLEAVLRSWEFKKDGRVWLNEKLGLVVDLVRYPYTGSFERTTIQPTVYGPVRLAAMEDLLVKRLLSTKFWKQAADAGQARLLADKYFDRIDWAYVEAYARREDVWDLAEPIKAAAEKARRRAGP